MKKVKLFFIPLILGMACSTRTKHAEETEVPVIVSENHHLFMDVHNLEPGKVTFDAVAEAHQKDLATEGKYGVHFLKYWVDEKQGKVYCLAESPDSVSIFNTHKDAHGLTPDRVQQVSEGQEAKLQSKGNLFFDVHYLGAGNVTSKAVADAHVKDLAVQGKYGVNFINYWVDEKLGVVMCVAEAPDSSAMINTHKEAHGLIPDEVHMVKQGN
jgi:uncharacterized protein YcfL